MYGQNDFKQPIFSMIMDQIIKTPKKRLYNIAAILLSEKYMLAANSTRALQYLAQLEENVITSEDYSGDTGEFDLNWFLLKSHRGEIAHSFVMNFYVYHELAHIKARQDPHAFYKDMICNIPNFGKTIHRCRKYCYMKYRNYLEEMMCALQMLEAKFGDVLEKYPPFSKEWEEEKRTAISILASIK